MPFQHVNRKGETYYLIVGKTKTGKPKYHAAKKLVGVPLDELPDGYEIHENPEDGIVHVRKVRPSWLLPYERDQVEEAVRSLAGQERFIVDVEGDSLVVYLPDTDAEQTTTLLGRIMGESPARLRSLKEWTERNCHYSAMMRFTLVDADRRLFSVERWCFLGSIDKWFPLKHKAPLAELLSDYAPHLGHESFFELM